MMMLIKCDMRSDTQRWGSDMHASVNVDFLMMYAKPCGIY